MDLKEFGRLLKEERLRQNLELSDVMEETKISRVSLEAIEEGNERALPHPVYAKGFVKNYARFLGLDADKMGNTMAQIYSSHDDDAASTEQLALADASKLPAVRHAWTQQVLILILAFLLVFALVACIWYLRAPIQGAFLFVAEKTGLWSYQEPEIVAKPEPERELERIVPDPAPRFRIEDFFIHDRMPVVPSPLDPPPLILPEADAPADATRSELEIDPDRVPEPDPQAVRPTPEQDAAEAPAVDLPAVPSVQEPVTAVPEERTLEIRAFQNCWLSTQADSEREREAFLRPGDRLVVSFKKNLELKLGNAGGVELYLDGRPWSLQARPGEVMVLRFP